MFRSIAPILILSLSLAAHATEVTVLLGSDGSPESRGIYLTAMDKQTGRWSRGVELAAPLKAAGFQVLHPALPVLYSAGALPGSTEQQVNAYRMDREPGGLELSHLNSEPTDSFQATHLAVDPGGRMLVTAHYKSGKIVVFPLQSDGSPEPHCQVIDQGGGSGVDPERQDQARPHCVTFSPDGGYVLICDLGADAIHVYEVDRQAPRLIPHRKAPAPPGSGPRHLKFSPDGRFAMVLNELDLTVSTYAWDEATGTLELRHVVPTLPESVKEQEVRNTAAELSFHPNGRFLYTSNRGNDSISVFRYEPETGRLALLEIEPARTSWPRHFAIEPSGKWLLCGGQDGSTVGLFAIDPDSGLLTYQPQSSIVVPHPICITFIPDEE